MRKVLGTVLFVLLLVFNASAARAASLSFSVSLDTSSLALAGGTYYLDFLLIDGNAASNSVEISNITGVDPVGPFFSFGSASGDLTSTVELNDSAPDFGVVEFFQQFTPSGVLSFLVTLTNNFTDPAPAVPTPDSFSFSILDDSFLPILTTDPLGPGFSRLLAFDLAGPSADFTDVELFQGVDAQGNPTLGITAAPVTAAPVPEPTSMLLLGSGLAAAGARRWKTRRQKA